MATFDVNDRVSFEREGQTLTGKIVTYDPYGRDGTTYVVECGAGPANTYHVPERFLRAAADTEKSA
jgi:hypothetical protein